MPEPLRCDCLSQSCAQGTELRRALGVLLARHQPRGEQEGELAGKARELSWETEFTGFLCDPELTT